MSGPPPSERVVGGGPQQEGSRLPLVCITCGMVYQPDEKNPHEACGATINFLTCNVNSAHNVVYLGDWVPGMACTEKQYINCSGILEDKGTTGPCPGRLMYKT